MAGYSRQSTADITASAVVKAAPINAEFNEILAAFAFSGGHNHDGTSTEGAYVGLIADVDALNKVVVDTSNNRVGIFTEVSSAAVEQIRIQDGAIVPVTDSDIDLGSSSAEFKDLYIDGTAHIDTLDIDENATIAGTLTVTGATALSGVLTFPDGSASAPSITNTGDTNCGLFFSAADTLAFSAGGTSQFTMADGVIAPVTDNDVDLGTSSLEFKDGYFDGTLYTDAINLNGTAISSTAAELNILDGVTATATELNIIDGDTSATSTTVADADRVVFNDGGTMKQVAVTDLAAYFDDEITAMPNLTSVGTLTTLTVDNVIVNGTTIGHTDDTDLITLADGVVTVAGIVSLPDGSASAPSITNTGDTNQGLYFSGTDTMAFTAGGTAQFTMADGAIAPVTDSDVDLGTSSLYFKDAYIDTVTTTGNVTIGGNLTVTGTQTVVDTVTMNAANAIVFEGATADAYETTLSIVDPTADHTQYLINQGGYIPVLAAATTTAITSTPAELNLLDGVTATTAELNILDGVTSTATELNVMDGDTSASSVTLADADRIVVNDDGTMKQVALTTLNTYIGSSTTTVGALNSGSITSGFGSIDNGSSAITTTGTITYGSLSDGTITITAFVDEDGMDSNSATLVPTQQSVKAYVDDNRNVTGLNATGAELNTVADASAISIDTSTAIANNDAILMYDNSATAMKYFDVDLLDTYYASTTQTLSNKTLTAPKIVDGGFIADANGNEIIMLQTASSAVNQLEVTNAATGGAIVVGASGDDSNIDIDISPKGTGEVNIAAGNLNYAGTAVTSTGAELNLLDGSSAGTIVNSKGVVYGSSGEVNATTLQIAGSSIASTAAELNIMDGDTAASSITLADADRLVLNDGGTMKQIALTTLKTYLTAAGYATTDDATALAIALG
tara:strand:+ start:14292 stop:17012 length:2721 start_codon:yes stop_codon:yes gene_type:complete